MYTWTIPLAGTQRHKTCLNSVKSKQILWFGFTLTYHNEGIIQTHKTI